MPKISPQSVPIMEGAALLVRRPNTPRWQVKYKVANRWLRTSTKQTDLGEAKKAAVKIILEAMHREQFGLPVVTRSFKSIAHTAIKRMEKELARGQGKVVYKDYIQAIQNYYIPYFGAQHITNVDHLALHEFDDWRAEKLKRTPKASTINTHTAALNRVFDEAMMQGYITNAQIPKIKNKVADGERRPDFAIEEYRELYRYMRKWVRVKMHRIKSTHMRLLLRDVVLILANSGIRYGTELYNLKWRHIRMPEGDIVMRIHGKTKPRDVIPRHPVKRYLRRIQLRNFPDLSFEEVLKLDEYVVQLPSGEQSKSLHQTFRKLLEDAKLKLDPRNDQTRTLYSLRHFYITQALLNKRTDLPTLAINCGTSIKMMQKHYIHLHVWDRREELMR